MRLKRRTKLARELRSNMTATEVRLWSDLRRRQLDGWKFRRQAPIGEYIADFYCPAARLVIELDGSSHESEEQSEYDRRRQRWLESQGYKVLRFSADADAEDYLEGVWETIDLELSKAHPRSPGRAVRLTPSTPPAH